MSFSHPDDADRITVEISRDLEDIVPIFLANRNKDLQILRDARIAQNFRTVETLGHRMKGDGGGFGFHQITEIGAAIERAAKLEDGLKRVAVVYR
jgi:histidine phosphotransfer protein HptB